ncbi:MAG: DUF6493 family protein [Micrococcales bacterium]|nr:DUF6493 family protein [Micrococcales bacterium]
MAKNPRLDEAVNVFKELGWANAAYADAPTLSLGTAQQREVALAGLRTGPWFDTGEWQNLIGVDPVLLGLFAVRVGVDARRAASVLLTANPPVWTHVHPSEDPDDALVVVAAERGPAFVAELVAQMARSVTLDEGGRNGRAVVCMVVEHDLPVPEQPAYLRVWAQCWDGLTWSVPATRRVPARTAGAGLDSRAPASALEARFAGHVRVAVALGMAGAGVGGLAPVLSAGVARGWLDRDEAVDLVLAALDAATRAPDHKAWLAVWLDDLAVTDAEVLAQVDVLVPVLAAVGAPAVERLAPTLITGVSDDLLPEVVTAALAATTKKALRVVLAALAARPRPCAGTVEVIAPLVTAVQDATLATAVAAVVQAWGLAAEPGPAPPTSGMWRPVPPVWQVPRFDPGPQTPAELAVLGAELVRRQHRPGTLLPVDIAVERFLVLANAVTRSDRAAAEEALLAAGCPGFDATAEGLSEHTSFVPDLLSAREDAVRSRLGQLPCLLSEPSWVDLRINPADLVARLRAYEQAGTAASEADLFLALTRLDTTMADEAVRAELADLPIPVVLLDACTMDLTAGPAAAAYLDDPVTELVLDTDRDGRWRTQPGPGLPQALRTFPRRLARFPWSGMSSAAAFPTWTGDALLVTYVIPEAQQGLVWRQVVRRATPLPPGGAMNLLVAHQALPPEAVRDQAVAIAEAWDRGLLRPDVADPRYLGWATPASKVATAARALAEVAADGMLAVAWPLLDDLVAACTGPRLTTGVAEVVQTVADLLPEVQHAVTTGLADPSVLDLPGVRALAACPGSSQAVKTARAVVAQLAKPS